MSKSEYIAYFPQEEKSQRVLVNPEHLKQLCIVLLYETKQNIVFIQRRPAEKTVDTVMVCALEGDDIKFYTLESKINTL